MCAVAGSKLTGLQQPFAIVAANECTSALSTSYTVSAVVLLGMRSSCWELLVATEVMVTSGTTFGLVYTMSCNLWVQKMDMYVDTYSTQGSNDIIMIHFILLCSEGH